MKNTQFFKDISRIYFIGIGGISLSALSIIMKSNGFCVSGSDEVKSSITQKLESLGIKINYKHSKKNIESFRPDLIVYSGAVKESNSELSFARKSNIKCLERADFLGILTKLYDNVISISGTHGKTTTTTMIAEIFEKAGYNPTIHIGGESVNLNSNVKVGSRDFFITEACEYRKSFLKFKTDVSVVLNVEEDHPDCYKNYDEILSAFEEFVQNTKLCCFALSDIKFKSKTKIINFNYKNAYFTCKNIIKTKKGYKFKVFKNETYVKTFELNIFGKHNVLNALAAICVADYFNIDYNIIKLALKEFKGITRRFEKIESKNFNNPVFADYAHHPTEIKKLIEETKSFNKSIICVFQPHTYSRTKKYFNDYLSCFNGSYQTILYKTYKAREKLIKGADAKSLFKSLKKQGENAFYYNSFNKIIKHLKKFVKPNCLILIVGAGDIYNLKSLI